VPLPLSVRLIHGRSKIHNPPISPRLPPLDGWVDRDRPEFAESYALNVAPVVTARLECGVPLGLVTMFLVAACAGAGCFFKKQQRNAKGGHHEQLQAMV
jgi:hypothetical protein